MGWTASAKVFFLKIGHRSVIYFPSGRVKKQNSKWLQSVQRGNHKMSKYFKNFGCEANVCFFFTTLWQDFFVPENRTDKELGWFTYRTPKSALCKCKTLIPGFQKWTSPDPYRYWFGFHVIDLGRVCSETKQKVTKMSVLRSCARELFDTLNLSDGAENLVCHRTSQSRARKKKSEQKIFFHRGEN